MCAAARNDRMSIALWLAALALLLRALVPGGTMLVPANQGWGAVLLPCPGAVPVATSTHRQHDPRGRETPHSADAAPCAFAGLAAPHLPSAAPTPTLAAPRPVAASRPTATMMAWRVPLRMHAPPPPSQAPPAPQPA